MSSSSVVHTNVASASCANSDDGEISPDDQDEKKLTLGDALSMTRTNEASAASFDELQNLAGGADIKVLH